MDRPKIPKNQKNFRLIFTLVIGLLIATLGYRLLYQNFNSYPAVGDTYDEYKAPFNGLSLLQKGYPESWSWYEHYGNFPVQFISGSNFRLVKPWFDEPPLFSIIAGLLAQKYDETDINNLNIGILRYPMLKFATLNIFVLFLIIYLVRGSIEAIVASLIYATTPTIVLLARLPLSDNMLTTFTLLSILFTVLYLKKGKIIFLIPVILLSALSLQLKSTGIFVPVAVTGILLAYKKFKPAISVIIFTAVSLGGWFIYGYHFGWDIFKKTMEVSSGRELFSPTVIINLFHTFRIGEKVMGIDGWVLWGWLSVIFFPYLSRHQNKLFKIILPVTIGCYLVFFSIMSGHIKGWYRAPLYPFISWAAASFIIKIFKSPRLLPFFFFVSISFFSSYVYGNGGIRWNNGQTKVFQIIFVALMSIPMLSEIFKNKFLKNTFRLLFLVIFCLSIIYNVRTIYLFQDHFYFGSL
jgi:hypothetical protein